VNNLSLKFKSTSERPFGPNRAGTENGSVVTRISASIVTKRQRRLVMTELSSSMISHSQNVSSEKELTNSRISSGVAESLRILGMQGAILELGKLVWIRPAPPAWVGALSLPHALYFKNYSTVSSSQGSEHDDNRPTSLGRFTSIKLLNSRINFLL
jgi:hypothetical protein